MERADIKRLLPHPKREMNSSGDSTHAAVTLPRSLGGPSGFVRRLAFLSFLTRLLSWTTFPGSTLDIALK